MDHSKIKKSGVEEEPAVAHEVKGKPDLSWKTSEKIFQRGSDNQLCLILLIVQVKRGLSIDIGFNDMTENLGDIDKGSFCGILEAKT